MLIGLAGSGIEGNELPLLSIPSRTSSGLPELQKHRETTHSEGSTTTFCTKQLVLTIQRMAFWDTIFNVAQNGTV